MHGETKNKRVYHLLSKVYEIYFKNRRVLNKEYVTIGSSVHPILQNKIHHGICLKKLQIACVIIGVALH